MNKDPLLTPQTIIATVTMLVFAGTVVAVFNYGSAETISQVVGGVTGLAGMVISFFFGSSRSSQAKDQTSAELQSKLADAVTTPTPPKG